jgi:hypothetical protein
MGARKLYVMLATQAFIGPAHTLVTVESPGKLPLKCRLQEMDDTTS